MKAIRFFLLLAAMAVSGFLSAQSLPYQFSFWKESYQPLSDANVLPLQVWDDFFVPVDLGFSFQLGEKTFESLQIGAVDGGLSDNFYLINGDTLQAIFGYNTATGLKNKQGTQLCHKLEGTAPNRIFIVEWLKAGFDGPDGEISFQIWLYETSNIIQVKLGPQTISSPGNSFINGHSPLCGLGINEFLDANGNLEVDYAHWINGPAGSPTDTILYDLVVNDPGDTEFGCDGVPEEGSVFTFTPANVSAVHTPAITETLDFYPVPAVGKIHFVRPAQSEAQIQILDMQGRLLFSGVLSAEAESLLLPAGLEPGTYLLRRIADGKVTAGKLITG